MSGRAVRSRLLELREARQAARSGREVLEQKLELLRGEFLRRTALRDACLSALDARLRPAREKVAEARVELGRRAIEAAALAQPGCAPLSWTSGRVAGVEVPKLAWSTTAFERRYGPGWTSAALDDAAAQFSALLPQVAALAGEEAAVRSLRRGLLRTARRLNALERAVLPAIETELRELDAALAEEEREESYRRKLWAEAGPAFTSDERSGAGPGSAGSSAGRRTRGAC
jgi:H(+)-transporting ATP synthase subunit D